MADYADRVAEEFAAYMQSYRSVYRERRANGRVLAPTPQMLRKL